MQIEIKVSAKSKFLNCDLIILEEKEDGRSESLPIKAGESISWNSSLQVIKPLLACASPHELTDARHQQIECSDSGAIVVLAHVKRFETLWVVVHNHRSPVQLTREPLLMLVPDVRGVATYQYCSTHREREREREKERERERERKRKRKRKRERKRENMRHRACNSLKVISPRNLATEIHTRSTQRSHSISVAHPRKRLTHCCGP